MLDWIEADKLKHIVAGFIVGAVCIAIGGHFDDALVGAYIAVTIVAAKEILWDYLLGKGNFEVLDFIASVIPIIILFLFYIL